MNFQVVSPKPFTRVSGAQELAQSPEAVGAAFTLPPNTASKPITGMSEVIVERVDNRIPANRAEFEKQKEALRSQALQTFRQQKVRDFLTNLKSVAKIDDRRKQVEASTRSTTSQ
jgi:parvulin-like peptidyl-prolyl isomerase